MKTAFRLAPVALRIVYGLAFAASGAVGLLQLAPQPPLSGATAAFVGGLAAAGYFFPLLKATELAAGLLLLSGSFVPLALTVLAPIVVNVAAFHFFLAPQGAPVAALLLLAEAVLAWIYRDAFAPLLRRASVPAERSGKAHASAGFDVQVGRA